MRPCKAPYIKGQGHCALNVSVAYLALTSSEPLRDPQRRRCAARAQLSLQDDVDAGTGEPHTNTQIELVLCVLWFSWKPPLPSKDVVRKTETSCGGPTGRFFLSGSLPLSAHFAYQRSRGLQSKDFFFRSPPRSKGHVRWGVLCEEETHEMRTVENIEQYENQRIRSSPNLRVLF